MTDTVTLTSEDESAFEFDEVVITSPLGWLKTNKPAFYPPLSARLSEAIDSIGYGSLEKVCLYPLSHPRMQSFYQMSRSTSRFLGLSG